MNARKREPLTDFSRIDRRYDLIVTKKNVDLSHQRHKIRNCHWNLFLHFPSYISHFLVTNTIMAHEIEFFQSYLISDLYLIYILNDFKKSNVCCFCYCPACRTTLVATRFRVAVICPIIQVPHCIRVFFYFVWFVFINHIFQFYYESCTYCNILDIYLS